MEYRRLGRTEFRVSVMGHGLWGMGSWLDSDDDQSRRALQTAVDHGCNFFDTAWAYGEGKSDRLLGELLRANPQHRLFVAAKVPPKNLKWPASPTDALAEVFPPDHIVRFTETIRKNVGVDCIDLLQLHVWDDAWADNPSWSDTVATLKRDGWIKAFGLSLNRWEPWNGIRAIRTGLVDTVQVIYNVFDQAPEDELFATCREYDVGVIARVPLDEGSLGGAFTAETRFPEGDWRQRYFGPENLPETVERVAALRRILPDGMTLPEMALRFVLANSDVATVIVGMRSLKHVSANLAVSDGCGLSSELIEALRAHRWDRKVEPWAN